jgi:pimeloyl-ACP methyl ester carboxylesterase
MTRPADPLPAPIRATAADLPPAVAAAVAAPGASVRLPAVEAAGIPWAAEAWGDPDRPPMLLVHGVTSHAAVFWLLGPAMAAAGRYVVAVDLPGHGRTGHWRDRPAFADTAADLAAYIRAAGLDRRDLAILGHSWGAMVVAHLPGAGIRPGRLILLDPPALTFAGLEALAQDPQERQFVDVGDALDLIRSANPEWREGDVASKAEGLTLFSRAAVLMILFGNGDWDAGAGAFEDPAVDPRSTWVIRGEPAAGGLLPDEAAAVLAARIGADHVLTIADGPHSPQRTHPEATVLAMLRALEG